LVGGRLVAGDAMTAVGDQLLDQLGARGLVLDQHLVRTEQAQLLPHGALERRVLEPPAEHSEEEEVLAFHSPRCAHREVAELGCLVGGVPALHDTVEALRALLNPSTPVSSTHPISSSATSSGEPTTTGPRPPIAAGVAISRPVPPRS